MFDFLKKKQKKKEKEIKIINHPYIIEQPRETKIEGIERKFITWIFNSEEQPLENTIYFIHCIFDDVTFINFNPKQIYIDHCHFTNCKFINSNFSGAKIINSHFSHNNFTRSNFHNVETFDSVLFDITGDEESIKMICPETGSFIGYKVAYYFETHGDHAYPCILKLYIPENAKRSSGANSKCRCDKAKVLDILSLTGNPLENVQMAFSRYNVNFLYSKNTWCSSSFDENRWNECTQGIHFFMKMEEALSYYYGEP